MGWLKKGRRNWSGRGPPETIGGMSEISERAAARRLNDRLGFGPAPGELSAGYDETVRRLLGPGPDAAAGAFAPPTGLEPPGKVASKSKEERKAAVRARAGQERKLAVWWLDRMVASRTAGERLTWFWHGHFATSNQKVRNAAWMLAQNQTQRTHALGRFGDLAQAMVVDTAMIRWLDGQRNRRGTPNENLAREFLELFTLGIGHYTEKDVAEGARCLTGWVLRPKATLQRRRFDAGSKTLFGTTGSFDAKGFAVLALSQPASAGFVIGRLWFRLVSSTPPDAATVARLAKAYGPERNVRSLLTAMVGEPAFRDSESALVKQPVEWAIGLMRALRIQPGKLPEKEQTKLLAGLRGMGQLPFRPPSVGGWPSGASWLTTSAGLTRLQLAQHLAKQAELPALSVDGVAALLGVDGWSARTKAALAGVKDPAQLTAVAACAPEYVVSG